MSNEDVERVQPVWMPAEHSPGVEHEVDVTAAESWQARIGQIETVLRFFGSLCSVSIERTVIQGGALGRDTVYLQARRVDGGLEVEMTGPQFLSGYGLDVAQQRRMVELGWNVPDGTSSPNFWQFLDDEVDLHAFAVDAARAFAEVYLVSASAEWGVSPAEFGDLEGFVASYDGQALQEVLEVDLDGEPIDELRRILRDGSGAELLGVLESEAITWADIVDAGLPGGDRRAELAMLYRHDCPIEFLRKSRFHLSVLGDPAWPTACAEAVLAAEPTSIEIERLAERSELTRGQVASAAVRGAKLANWRGRSGARFLQLAAYPPRRLEELAKLHDDDAAGMLRHPRCPEDVVLRHILSRSSRVRYLALLATRNRVLAIDSALIRLAKELPMTERPNTPFPYAKRARQLADTILESR